MATIDIVISELRSLFPDWESTVPSKIWPVIEQTAYETSVDELEDFLDKYRTVGKEWGFHPYAPFARRILKNVLYVITDPVLGGLGNLEKGLDMVKEGKADRLILLTNHLSYADANLLATLLQPTLIAKGFGDDFSVVVGPKVYNQRFKAFSSLQFNSLLIAQSLTVATQEATLSIREIARAAKKVMVDIHQQVKVLLIFPEGGRSRTGNLNRLLPGVIKLIEAAGNAVVVPASIIGGNVLLPINDSTLHYARVDVTVGEPILMSDMHARFGTTDQAKPDIMDHFGRCVAATMPPERRGHYAQVNE